MNELLRTIIRLDNPKEIWWNVDELRLSIKDRHGHVWLMGEYHDGTFLKHTLETLKSQLIWSKFPSFTLRF